MSDVCRRLEEFLGGSEQVFLEAGKKLQALQSSAVRLVADSGAAADVGQGGAEDPSQQLRRELEQIRGHLERSRQTAVTDAAGLAQLVERVGALERFRQGYHQLSNTLRLIAVQTRVESARHDAQLDRVATDTRRLAQQIEPKYEEVLAEATRLEQVAGDARGNTLTFLSQQGTRGEAMVADTCAGLEALQALASSASALVAQASGSMQRVAARVSEVLIGLQVHDSIRQVLEHVIEELRELVADREETAQEFFAETAGMCRLEARQLRAARSRMVEGLEQISTGLLELAAQVSKLAVDAQQVASGHGSELVRQVEQGVGASARLLREQLESELSLSRALQLVDASLTAMSARVTQIERIGREVKLISLNAMVETNQASAGARVFEALAQSMTEAATEVSHHNQGVTAALERVATEAATLSHAGGQQLSQDGSGGATIADRLDQVASGLSAWHAGLLARVEELQQGSAALSGEAGAAAGGLTAQVRAAGLLEELELELGALAAVAEAEAGPERGCSSRRLERAAARYTMDSERTVHTSEAGPVALPAGESFPRAAAAPAEGLGDNVELF
jgi:hypothetical protein